MKGRQLNGRSDLDLRIEDVPVSIRSKTMDAKSQGNHVILTNPNNAKPAFKKIGFVWARLHKKTPTAKSIDATIPHIFGPVLSSKYPKGNEER